MSAFNIPHDDLYNPCIKAFNNLGGSATNLELEEEVIRILELSDEEANDIHKNNITKINYRLGWAKYYLKKYGILENSSRGVWVLTNDGRKIGEVDKTEVNQKVRAYNRERRERLDEEISNEDEPRWQDKLLETLKKMDPAAFERLSQLLLRELGFNNVEVTGKSGDGGIDGKGILKIGSVISFRIVFQCKRYKESVSSSVVRDFRGAFQGRADKGLLISTGSFTRDAKTEAQRDGALAIDLIDGEELATKLKELGLGITVRLVEETIIDDEWFNSI